MRSCPVRQDNPGIVVPFKDHNRPRFIGNGDAIDVVESLLHGTATKVPRNDGVRRQILDDREVPQRNARAAGYNDGPFGWR